MYLYSLKILASLMNSSKILETKYIYIYILGILASNFIYIYIYIKYCLWFWYHRVDGFIEWLWECSLHFSLLEEFETDQCKFFFECLVEFLSEAICSWTFVCREFFIIIFADSISLLVVGLFKLSISSWFSFDRHIFLETCPCLLGCSVGWHIIVLSMKT